MIESAVTRLAAARLADERRACRAGAIAKTTPSTARITPPCGVERRAQVANRQQVAGRRVDRGRLRRGPAATGRRHATETIAHRCSRIIEHIVDNLRMVDNRREAAVRCPSVMRTLPGPELARHEPSIGLRHPRPLCDDPVAVGYVFKRILVTIPTLIGISIIVFLMVRLLPGDVVDVVLGGDQSATRGGQAAGA